MSTPDEGSGDDPLLLGAERSTAPAFAANAPSRHDALDPFDDSDDDGARVARPDGFHGVTPSWNIILNSMLYMAAPLSMPATTAAGGWFWSFVFWAYCSCATYWTGLVVGRAYNANPSCDLSTYPRMAGEAFARLSLRRDPSDALAARAWRRRGIALLVCTQFVTFYLDTVTQIIFLAEYLAQIFPARRACPWVWLLVVWIATVPVVQIPTFHASRWIVVPAFAVLVASVCLFFAETFVVAPWDCDPGPTFPPPTPSSAFVSLANFAYAYGGHGMFPESLREMRRPKDWPRVMRWCYGVMVPLYLACGAVGYRAYGGFAKARRQPQFSGQPSQRRVAGPANPADVLPRLLHQRRHDHRRGTTRARNRTRIRREGPSCGRTLAPSHPCRRAPAFRPPGSRARSSRPHSCPAARRTSSSTRRRSREPWE